MVTAILEAAEGNVVAELMPAQKSLPIPLPQARRLRQQDFADLEIA